MKLLLGSVCDSEWKRHRHKEQYDLKTETDVGVRCLKTKEQLQQPHVLQEQKETRKELWNTFFLRSLQREGSTPSLHFGLLDYGI